MRALRYALLILGLGLLAAAIATAETTYSIQPIVKAGDTIGDIRLRSNSSFFGTALNDAGHLVFVSQDTAGGLSTILCADDRLLPLAVTGGAAPGGGTWARSVPAYLGTYLPSINRSGNVVFPGLAKEGSRETYRTFLWDREAQELQVLTLPGMPVPGNLTLEEGFDGAINNRGEIALHALARDAAKRQHHVILLRSAEGQLQPAVLPGLEMPDGRKLQEVWIPVLTDAGVVAFVAQQPSSVYLWEKGVFSSIVSLSADAPGGGKIVSIWYAAVNNLNRNVLLQAILNRPWTGAGSGPHGLYLAGEGKLVPVAVPGQEMPGGGHLTSVLGARDLQYLETVSTANERGQHAFVAQITEGGSTQTALYLMEPDGKLSLVLKSGTVTDMGPITRVGTALGSRSVALNSQGQIAVPIRITGLPEMLVLLKPQAR